MEENQPLNVVDQPTLEQLPDDLLRNIFHRLPSDPSAFAFVSAAYKAWRRVVHDEDNFLRHFLAAHANAPPLLGLFSDALYDKLQFNPTTNSGAVNLPTSPPRFHAYGCTHGRLLLHVNYSELLLVWDPLTGDNHLIRSPPPGFRHGMSCGAALVCGADHANHGDCHSSPFRVVFAYSEHGPPSGWHPPMAPLHTYACVYNSETRSWGDRPAATMPVRSYFEWKPSAVACNVNGAAVYWLTEVGDDMYVLKFDLGTPSFQLTVATEDIYDANDYVLVPTVDGGLGLAGVMGEFIGFSSWENGAWAHRVLVWLHQLLAWHELDALQAVMQPRVVAFSQESNSIFLQAVSGVYIINLESGQHQRVLETDQHLCSFYPYYSFYTAAGKAILNDVQVEQENISIQSGGENSMIEEKSKKVLMLVMTSNFSEKVPTSNINFLGVSIEWKPSSDLQKFAFPAQ